MTTQTDGVLTEEWQTALSGAAVPQPADNFFDQGGRSVSALRFVARVENRRGIQFPLETLFVDGSFGAVPAGVSGAAGMR
jgi:hypothetical protein